MVYLVSELWPFMALAFVFGTLFGWRALVSSKK